MSEWAGRRVGGRSADESRTTDHGPPDGLRPKGRRYLAAVAALFALAWALGAAFGPFERSDAREYLYQAENLEAGRPPFASHWPPDPARTEMFTLRPPGYAAFLVAARAVSEGPLWLAAVQSALGVATWWLVWWVAVRLGQPRRPAALVAGLLATPATLLYAQQPMADTLFTFLVVAAVACFVAFVVPPDPLAEPAGASRQPSGAAPTTSPLPTGEGQGEGPRQTPRSAATASPSAVRAPALLLAFHGLLAAALWVKPVVLYVWPITLAATAWALWRRGRRGAALWPAAGAALVPLAALALAALNATWTGHPEVTSMQTHNLAHQNAHRTLMRTGEVALHDAAEARADRIADYGERQERRRAWATGVILDRPLDYAAVHLTGMAALVLDPGRFDLATFFDLDSAPGAMTAGSRDGPAGALAVLLRQPPALLAVLAVLLALNVAVALSFVAWVARGDAPVEVRVLLFLLVGYVVLVTGPVGSARYRMPVAPLVALALPWASAVVASRFERARP